MAVDGVDKGIEEMTKETQGTEQTSKKAWRKYGLGSKKHHNASSFAENNATIRQCPPRGMSIVEPPQRSLIQLAVYCAEKLLQFITAIIWTGMNAQHKGRLFCSFSWRNLPSCCQTTTDKAFVLHAHYATYYFSGFPATVSIWRVIFPRTVRFGQHNLPEDLNTIIVESLQSRHRLFKTPTARATHSSALRAHCWLSHRFSRCSGHPLHLRPAKPWAPPSPSVSSTPSRLLPLQSKDSPDRQASLWSVPLFFRVA